MKRERTPGFILDRGRLVSIEEWYLRFTSKRKRRKGHYMRYFSRWEGRHQSTKALAARASRREGKATAREIQDQ